MLKQRTESEALRVSASQLPHLNNIPRGTVGLAFASRMKISNLSIAGVAAGDKLFVWVFPKVVVCKRRFLCLTAKIEIKMVFRGN